MDLISFGFLHATQLPEADRIEDVRRRLRDPARARDILDLDGRDKLVQHIVWDTPGAAPLLDNLADYAKRCRPAAIAIGCAGGKHRAPALVELLAKRLRITIRLVTVRHLHIHLPRVLRQGESA
jgi:RNase adaptor protein for sRNA GlmZ degradation